MMNRLVILLAVAVVMAMCSAPSEGKKNFFIFFFNPRIIHEGKKQGNQHLENFWYWILISIKFKIIILLKNYIKHFT